MYVFFFGGGNALQQIARHAVQASPESHAQIYDTPIWVSVSTISDVDYVPQSMNGEKKWRISRLCVRPTPPSWEPIKILLRA